MKTYKELLSEIDSIHSAYDRWGIIYGGKIYHGSKSSANTHGELHDKVDEKYHRGEKLGWPSRVDWAQEKSDPEVKNTAGQPTHLGTDHHRGFTISHKGN